MHPKTALDMLMDQWRETDPQRHSQWSAARAVLYSNGANLPSLTLVFAARDRALAMRVQADQAALASATLATGVLIAIEVGDDARRRFRPLTHPREGARAMLTCHRTSLIMWSSDELLYRDQSTLRVCNEAEVTAAVAAMEAGETILLVDDAGRIVSKCRVADGAFHEIAIDPG